MMEKIIEKSFSFYSSYKDSKVDWIGVIPEHWELTRLGTRFLERRTKVSDKDFSPLSVTKNGILPQLDNAAKTNDGDNRKLVRQGDFVINSRSDRKGSSGIAYSDGSVSLINIVIELRNIDPNYCNYLLKGHAFVEEFYRMGHGIVADLWTTRYDEMKSIMIGLPPFKEQTAIANFLDRKTALIDKAIRIKERQIELLKERRQILIHKAVTRGLNPNVKMKDSGVEWIGEIPEGWSGSMLKRYWTVLDCKHLTVKYFDEGFPVASIQEAQTMFIDLSRAKKTSKEEYHKMIEGGRKPVIGDLIYSRNATVGEVTYVNEEIDFCMGQDVCLIRSANHNQLFLSYLLKSDFIQNILELTMKGSTFKRINIQDIKEFPVVVPPIDEQNRIVKYLLEKTRITDCAMDKAKQQIDKLKEYKTSLINSAVTGKIKVA
jgi:type I restriction enzyme S subunit